MGYGDNRYGGRDQDRWRNADQGSRSDRERGSYGDWNRDRGQGGWDRGESHDRGGDDRGFIERAEERVRSWFSDDDDRGGQDRNYRGGGRDDYRGSQSFGGGFGNQRGWNDDHFDRDFGPERGRRDDRGEDNTGGGGSRSAWGGGGGGAEPWEGSGFGGPTDRGRRFDRVDPGHVGAQGAHPMSAPVESGYAGYGATVGGGGATSSAREAAILANARGGNRGNAQQGRGGFGQGGGYDRGQAGGYGQRNFGGGMHDPHYSEWRQRQMDQLDNDYEDYRREHQSRFEQEFAGWREKRQTQRQHFGRVTEHMEVIGSDGQHVGTVDKVRGDRIILTKSDPSAGGHHHSIPCGWIDTVDDKLKINKTAEEARNAWRDEEQNKALFERNREQSGSQGDESGPHMLDRSFSGTYSDRNDS